MDERQDWPLTAPVKGLEYERIIVTFSNHIGHNAPIIEIQNGTEVDFVYFYNPYTI